ncbi:MAG: bifunctional oligoribonuclease/PAP phosphatase NrnA [Clostridia bacterium]|nr:bifunctional oligoribonuclease/PAP phosphatase NrnA [Clostridia bacterium]
MGIESKAGWLEQVRKGTSFLLISHVNPDGDTIGSVLGLRLALLHMGKKVKLVCDGDIPKNMSMLTGHECYLKPDQVEGTFDAAIAVDVSSPDMMGASLPLFEAAPVRMVMDHHSTNQAYGDINWICRGESANCQIVYDAIMELGVPLTKEIANCVLLGLSTDTGHFQYASTTARTIHTAAALVDAGGEISRISKLMYRSQPMRRIQMTKIAYQKMHFENDGQIGMLDLTKADFERTGCTFGEADGLVNLALEIEGVRFAFLASERENGIKISLRAAEPDTVNDVAVRFGGGGHAQAAGCTLYMSLEEAKQTILEAIQAKL